MQFLQQTFIAMIVSHIFLFYTGVLGQSSCSLGNLVFEENFGTGSARLGPSLNQDPNNVHPNFRPADLYTYIGSGSIGPDQYGIIKNGKDAAPGGADWNDDFRDHTGNLNGYMYYCDAKEDLNVFYAQKITGLCSEIEYELSAWFAKSNAPDYFIDPNVKLIVGFTDINDQDLGVVDSNTGPIEGIGSNRWSRSELVFTVPIGTENIYFMLKNNVAGVAGNDLAIDDIQIRPCGPQIELTNDKTGELVLKDQAICLKDPDDLSIQISGAIDTNFVMQWQESLVSDVWVDIPNENKSLLQYNLENSSGSQHKIRLKFAHNLNNLANSSCHFFSDEIIFSKTFASPIEDVVLCDDLSDGDDTNGISSDFDLEALVSDILGDEQLTEDFLVSFHLNGFDANTGVNPLSSPHSNGASPFTQEIFVRIQNEKTGCVHSSQSFNLRVIPVPLDVEVEDIEKCDDEVDGNDANGVVQNFNLEEQTIPILGTRSLTEYKVTYHLSQNDAILGEKKLSSPHSNEQNPNNETIYVRVQNLRTGCVNSRTKFNLIVHSLPKVNSIENLALCDDNFDGNDTNGVVQTFDLDGQTSLILEGVANADQYTVSYHLSALEAELGENSLGSPHTNALSPFQQTIFTRIKNDATGCITLGASFDLVVHPLPIISSSVKLKQCDDDVDGFSTFNLWEVNAKISSYSTNESFSYHTSYDDALEGVHPIPDPLTYVNKKVTSDKVWARVISQYGCARIAEIELVVSTTGIPTSYHKTFSVCDDFIDVIQDDMDGVSSFDFSSVDSEIRAIFPVNQQLIITYYRNKEDALAEQNAIQDITNYRNIGFAHMQQIYVRVDSTLNNDCLGFGAHITLNVETLPDFEVESPRIICDSGSSSTITLEIEQNSQEVYDYQWTDELGNIIAVETSVEVSQPGIYFITLFKTDGSGCPREKQIEVVFSEKAKIDLEHITIVDNADNNTIFITNENESLGAGDYEFSLNDPNFGFQDSPYFENVSPGIHTLYVQDKNGCDPAEIEVSVIGYPKFFTPNNDGQNDTWKVLGVSHEFYSEAIMYIFDRFGKIVAKIDPRLEDWNGTYNGELLQANDYWYTSELIDTQGTVSVQRGHFSLIRR